MNSIICYRDETLFRTGYSEAKIKLKYKANCFKKENMRVESADEVDEVQLHKEKEDVTASSQ